MKDFTDSNQSGAPPKQTSSGSAPQMMIIPPQEGPTDPYGPAKELLTNLNEKCKDYDPALFRDGLVAQTVSGLIGKSKPNVLLTGSAGVGKTAIAEDIARRIVAGDPLIPEQLAEHTVYELQLTDIIAGSMYQGMAEAKTKAIIEFASDEEQKVILFIDEIHMLASRSQSYQMIAEQLKPALARGQIHVIGATTSQESKDLDDDPAFSRRFTKLTVDELTPEQTVTVMKKAVPSLVRHYRDRIAIEDDLLPQVVSTADEYGSSVSRRPDNALTLLDRAMADLVVSHGAKISEAKDDGDDDLVNALESMDSLRLSSRRLTKVAKKITTGQAEPPVFDRAAMTESFGRIIGQDEVVSEVLGGLSRHTLGVKATTSPLAWMFAGPSGVGKTEMTRIIAEELTGQPPIVLNMGEYSNRHDESKLIGSGPGLVGSDSKKELPFDTLKSNPYRVILFDEIEKAHHEVRRLLLSPLDTGWLRMASGEVIDFSRAILIGTTNAAAESMGKPKTGFSAGSSDISAKMERQDLLDALKPFFEPEFLGRFTEIMEYSRISPEVYGDILAAAYSRFRERTVAALPRRAALLPVDIDPDALSHLVATTYQKDQGARPAETAAIRHIEDLLIAAGEG